MASTTKVPLGASTLNRKWYLDVNTGPYEAPVWTGVFGVMEFKAPKTPTLQNDSDYDSAGWKSSVVTALAWSIDLKLARKVTVASATAYDAGQEVLRAASDLLGSGNRVDIRWYEVTSGGPTTEAYRGYATVTWMPDGGDMEAAETVTVTLTGQGARTAITHPDAAGAAVPVIARLTPYTDLEAGGAIVQIAGSGFLGTIVEGVLFGVEIATFVVMNDNLIIATAPAQSAATVEVTVENATGVSTVTQDFIYTAAQ